MNGCLTFGGYVAFDNTHEKVKKLKKFTRPTPECSRAKEKLGIRQVRLAIIWGSSHPYDHAPCTCKWQYNTFKETV